MLNGGEGKGQRKCRAGLNTRNRLQDSTPEGM